IGHVRWLNPVAERLTGWPTAEAQGQPLVEVFNIINEETREQAENPVATCLQQGEVVGLANHTLLIARNGDEFGIEDSAAPIRNAHGEILGVVLVFHDVTEQRRLTDEMNHRATHDALTGLVNRAEFEMRLRRVLAHARDEGREHALMYIDLDQFKLVNDACGHSIGDQLLQQVSKLLLQSIRARDTLARLGGDEFGVILEHCSALQAERAAQQICERMDDFRFQHDGRRFRIGASIGLVALDDRWATPATVMQAADTACYAAKEAGRNRVHTWFDTDLAMHARHGEMQWATRIEQALDEDRFVLFAQRIEAVNGGPCQALHAEVLLRMIDGDGTLVSPGAFLPAAERFQLSSRIDRRVLRQTIDVLAALEDLDSVETLCINVSGQSVGDRVFHRHAIETLSEAGTAVCQRICLEITETAAVTNPADAALFIAQVRKLGVRIALDDFGAGASSFSYLKTLPVDLLKIDGQFITDLLDDPLDDVAVRCFVDVARVIGVKTVAEFVERREVLEQLRLIGVDYAQGFLLHRPEPIGALLQSSRVRPRLQRAALHQ
ncbi:MAG: EAL domain-containing protein, partial [Gammaproteobacteria bacterium]